MRTITVIHPGEFTATYNVESNAPDLELLEEVFANWNAGSGCEIERFLKAKVRSLSVNDIVKIDNPVRMEGKYYLCESLGWTEVTKEFVSNLEETVKSHPDFEDNGSWFVLNDVMRLYRKGTLKLC